MEKGNDWGKVQAKQRQSMLSNLQEIIGSDKTLNRINNTLKGEIVDMFGGIISQGNPIVNDLGHATIMSNVNLNVNENTKLAILDDWDIEQNSLSFSESMVFAIGIRGSDFGIEVLDMFSLLVGLDNLAHAHFTGAFQGETLKNITQNIMIQEQRLMQEQNKGFSNERK